MKKILFIFIILIILIVVGVPMVKALEIQNPLKYDTVGEVIEAIAEFIAILGSSIAVIMIIWGGIQYMTSGSSTEKVNNAKKTIMWAIIGIAILWSAKFLIDLVAWVLGKQT